MEFQNTLIRRSCREKSARFPESPARDVETPRHAISQQKELQSALPQCSFRGLLIVLMRQTISAMPSMGTLFHETVFLSSRSSRNGLCWEPLRVPWRATFRSISRTTTRLWCDGCFARPANSKIKWPAGQDEDRAARDPFCAGRPLFDQIGLAAKPAVESRAEAWGADPAAFVVVGQRKAPVGRPPEMSEFNVSDLPATGRSGRTGLVFELKRARVVSQGHRVHGGAGRPGGGAVFG